MLAPGFRDANVIEHLGEVERHQAIAPGTKQRRYDNPQMPALHSTVALETIAALIPSYFMGWQGVPASGHKTWVTCQGL